MPPGGAMVLAYSTVAAHIAAKQMPCSGSTSSTSAGMSLGKSVYKYSRMINMTWQPSKTYVMLPSPFQSRPMYLNTGTSNKHITTVATPYSNLVAPSKSCSNHTARKPSMSDIDTPYWTRLAKNQRTSNESNFGADPSVVPSVVALGLSCASLRGFGCGMKVTQMPMFTAWMEAKPMNMKSVPRVSINCPATKAMPPQPTAHQRR
mmetsp:Transcript_133051/g.384864  ORF Transcript_133051/g.384864 Transcript_133051/m.384864 type:complete len:205 (-) Transcript_133051:549-1163(-)